MGTPDGAKRPAGIRRFLGHVTHCQYKLYPRTNPPDGRHTPAVARNVQEELTADAGVVKITSGRASLGMRISGPARSWRAGVGL